MSSDDEATSDDDPTQDVSSPSRAELLSELSGPQIGLFLLLAAGGVGAASLLFGEDTPNMDAPTSTDRPGDGSGGTPTESPPDESGGTLTDPVIRDPDPPNPDLTTATSVASRWDFLYTSDEPVQRDVDPADIEEVRLSVCAGRVIDREGDPIAGVSVWISGRPEFGYTATREDGRYEMVFNGGGRTTLEFAKEGYLPAQRSVNLAWNEETVVEDVALVRPDGDGTDVEMDTDEARIVEGARIEDDDGARRAIIIVPPNTSGMRTDDGTAPQALTIRTAEYTVGERGPEAMPAGLPPATAYTYASEFFAEFTDVESSTGTPTESSTETPTTSTDTSTATPPPTSTPTPSGDGSSDVGDSSDRGFIGAGSGGDLQFDRPVILYLENFLDFPVGTPVPVGAYDRDDSQWVPSNDGLVVKILRVANGTAVLDLTGDGSAADAEALSTVGIGEREREQLADRYDAGQELWRTPLPHFSPWDCNWPFRPPDDAERPPGPRDDPPEDPYPCP